MQEAEGTVIRSILLVGVVGLLYVFPLFAAWVAYHRDRRGWALATMIAEVLSVGLIVGIFALRQRSDLELAQRQLESAESAASDSDAIQCPSCHGAAVSARALTTYREGGKKAPSRTSTTIQALGGTSVAIVCVLVALVLLLSPTQLYEWRSGTPGWVPAGLTPDQLLALSAFGLAGFFGIPGLRARRLSKNYTARVATAYNLTCRTCGHAWTVDEAEPEAEPEAD